MHMPGIKGMTLADSMGFHGIAYFCGSGLRLIRQNIAINIMAVGTVALSFLIFSAFFLIFQNLNSFLILWEDNIQIIAYLKDGLTEGELERIRLALDNMSEVKKVRFVSKEGAMGILRRHLGDQDQVLEGFTADILPASFEIQLHRVYRNTGEIRRVVSQLRSTEGVSDIQYGQKWIDRFSVFMDIYRSSTLLLGLLLSVAIAFIVSNAIRLSIYSRREELEIMKLVGATPGFIKIPFYIEGGLQGLIGSAISLVILLVLHSFFLSELSQRTRFYGLFVDVHFLTPVAVLSIIVGGGLLGFLGSLLSLARLKEN
jgi:cell division transport system permease protein